MMVGRLGAVISTNVIGNIINEHCEVTFYSMSLVVLTCAFVAFLLPQPK